MAIRRPLKRYGLSGLQEMTAAEVTALINYAVFKYGQSPAVLLNVQASGNLGNISDTRKKAGAASSQTGGAWPASQTYPPESTTGEPGTVTVQWNKIQQSFVSPLDPTLSTNLNPCYYDPVTGITEMTAADMRDTFIGPAIDIITASTVSASTAGTYFVSTSSSETDCTAKGIVFVDTRANTSLYSAGGIPEDRDQPQDIQYYHLHLRNNTATNPEPLPSNSRPVRIYYNGTNAEGVQEIPQYGTYSMNTLFLYYMQWYTVNVPGYRISYNWSGSGNSRGSMTDTILNGNGNYQQYEASANDYRAQEFPNGSAVTAQTHTLKILRS